ncbi:MAG: hypothetical protein Salg2KO_22120 [Salibacteraceae bacterium]
MGQFTYLIGPRRILTGVFMSNEPVSISVIGEDQQGDDAPLVKDVLGQVSDLTDLLSVVGKNITDGDKPHISWKMTGARKNSPLTFDVAPFTTQTDSAGFQAAVVLATLDGLNELQGSSKLPNHFSGEALKISSRIYKRVTNGIATTNVDAKLYADHAHSSITPSIAHRALANIEEAKAKPLEYRELGSVEGTITAIELDGYNRPTMHMLSRIDNQDMKCTFSDGLDRIGHYEVGQVLNGLRVRVFGSVFYKGLGKISRVVVDEVHVLEVDETLPDIDDIVSPNFTDGLTAEEYLSEVREYG